MELTQRRKRGLVFLAGFAALVGFYTVVYNVGMATLENDPQPLYHSFRVVVESFTTTGYGSDAPWRSMWMNFLVVAMQATGITAVFFALPLFIVPLFEDALRTTAPTHVEGLRDHVVICGLTARGEVLLDELEARDVEYVVVEPDDERAAALYSDDRTVIRGDPESVDDLRDANVGDASSVIADASDERNASIILSVREVNRDVSVVSLVEKPENAAYQRYAGADQALLPQRMLGRSLAGKVTTRVEAVGEDVSLNEDLQLAELTVHPDCEIVGQRLDESQIRERTGANVVGIWDDGEFRSSPAPDTRLSAGIVLIAAGSERQLDALRDRTRSKKRRHGRGSVVVAGYGDVGSTVADELRAADVSTTILDREDAPGVDIVGDVTDEWTLSEADISEANTIILALSDDTETIFATLVIGELNPECEIVARANEAESVRKLYQAGADYVLALSTVSGRMLASTILDEEVMSLDTQVEIVRTRAPDLAGQSLGEADVRARTGCTVIAVERNGDVLTDVGAEFVIRPDDELVVVGDDENVIQFKAIAGGGDVDVFADD